MSKENWNRVCLIAFLLPLVWVLLNGGSIIALLIWGLVVPFIRMGGNNHLFPPKTIDDICGIHYGPLCLLYMFYAICALYLCSLTGVPLKASPDNTGEVPSLALMAAFYLAVGIASFVAERKERCVS